MNATSDAEFRSAIFPDRPFGPMDATEERQWTAIRFLFAQGTLRAQAYEDALARFVAEAETREHRKPTSKRSVWRLTLGALQKEYARYCFLESEHLERMAAALHFRNSLAHNFYRRRIDLLETPEGRDLVIVELQRADDLLKRERDDVYWNLSLLTGTKPL